MKRWFKKKVWCGVFTLFYFLSVNIPDCSKSIGVLDCRRCFPDGGPLWWQRFWKQPGWICRLQSDVKGMEAADLINLIFLFFYSSCLMLSFYFPLIHDVLKNTQVEAISCRLIDSESSICVINERLFFLFTEIKQLSAATKEKRAHPACTSLW